MAGQVPDIDKDAICGPDRNVLRYESLFVEEYSWASSGADDVT